MFATVSRAPKLTVHGRTLPLALRAGAVVIPTGGSDVVARCEDRVGRRPELATPVTDAQHAWRDAR